MSSELLRSVREILLKHWDPIGLNQIEQCRDEYDSYAPAICRLLMAGVDEYRLTAYLDRLAREEMGLLLPDDGRHRRVARRLLALVAE